MAKLFKHLGIGGKKVSDQPCQGEFMSSGSVQELRSTSPSKNRASTIVVPSNSWLASGVGPDVNADVRRHSDASTIRSVRSRLSSQQKSDFALRGGRSRGGGMAHRDGHCAGQNGTRSPCEQPQCTAIVAERCSVTSPQIATEYCDPYDLKLQKKADDGVKLDVKASSSEDDYCVPYEVQKVRLAEHKDGDTEARKLSLSKADEASCEVVVTSVLDVHANDLAVKKKPDDSCVPNDSAAGKLSRLVSTDFHDEDLLSGSESADVPDDLTAGELPEHLPDGAAEPEKALQESDVIKVNEVLGDQTQRNSENGESSTAACGLSQMQAAEDAPVLADPSAGMYDAPWDLWATQKNLEEKLLKASQAPQQSTSSYRQSSASSEESRGIRSNTGKPQEINNVQIYEEPWDKKAESLQQSLFLAETSREADFRRTVADPSQPCRSLAFEPNRFDRFDHSLRQKQCGNVGEQQKVRTGVRTGVSSCYSVQSPLCAVHSLQCQHRHDYRHSMYQSQADVVDEYLPLEKQSWYHGSISRVEAEMLLRLHREGSYLVRTSESNKQDYSLSLKSSSGEFMHMKIVRHSSGFILGQFSQPFRSIPQMILYYTINKLPIRGTEHMTLSFPVCNELL